MHKLALLGCLDVADDILKRLLRARVPIGAVFGLSPAAGLHHGVCGYRHLATRAAAHGIPYADVSRYDLKDPDDARSFAACNCSALLVAGWTRLVPEGILTLFPDGCFGLHGSAELLPRGRGRSPINWSLIENRSRFVLHLFMLRAGVDDGDLLDRTTFDILAWDDCRTLYMKNSIAASRMMIRAWESISAGRTLPALPQIGAPTYYAKRTPSDGRIDWSKPMSSIHNLVRAVTHPYPGASTMVGAHSMVIWRAQPFDTRFLYPDAEPGTVVEVFDDDRLVIHCVDGLLLVTEWECPTNVTEGTVLH